MSKQSSHPTTGRWLVGSVVVPIVLALIGIGGVRLMDFLYPPSAPSIEVSDTSQLNQSILKLESQVNLLVNILRDDRNRTRENVAQIPTRTPPTEAVPSTAPKKQLTNAEAARGRLEVRNSSKLLGRKLYVGRQTWEWTIYIEADDKVLNQIECVIYTLHPTFPNPIQKLCRNDLATNPKFSYTTRGWGTFVVKVLIQFKDDSEMHQRHQLVFTRT